MYVHDNYTLILDINNNWYTYIRPKSGVNVQSQYAVQTKTGSLSMNPAPEQLVYSVELGSDN
jgi:hypothetical protein